MAAKAPVKKNLSALKRARQGEKRNLRNRIERTKIRSAIKAVESAVAENSKDASEAALRKAVKTITASVPKGVLHKNSASRKVSRLVKKVNAVTAGPA